MPEVARHHARQEGFDLHAGVRVAADARERLEKLCRLCGAPHNAAVGLALTALAAGVLPARRAARIDPAVTLRSE